jgi:hypothetical protein
MKARVEQTAFCRAGVRASNSLCVRGEGEAARELMSLSDRTQAWPAVEIKAKAAVHNMVFMVSSLRTDIAGRAAGFGVILAQFRSPDNRAHLGLIRSPLQVKPVILAGCLSLGGFEIDD